jgi:hypothetical protein
MKHILVFTVLDRRRPGSATALDKKYIKSPFQVEGIVNKLLYI